MSVGFIVSQTNLPADRSRRSTKASGCVTPDRAKAFRRSLFTRDGARDGAGSGTCNSVTCALWGVFQGIPSRCSPATRYTRYTDAVALGVAMFPPGICLITFGSLRGCMCCSMLVSVARYSLATRYTRHTSPVAHGVATYPLGICLITYGPLRGCLCWSMLVSVARYSLASVPWNSSLIRLSNRSSTKCNSTRNASLRASPIGCSCLGGVEMQKTLVLRGQTQYGTTHCANRSAKSR